MRDRVCPIGECTATVRFEAPVEEVTPRYRLHDLGEVDEFASCPDCDAEIAGFYPEGEEAGEGDVELILDIDDDGDDQPDAAGNDDGSGEADAGGERDGFDAVTDDFDDPDDVLEEAVDEGDSSGEDAGGEGSVFGSGDDE